MCYTIPAKMRVPHDLGFVSPIWHAQVMCRRRGCGRASPYPTPGHSDLVLIDLNKPHLLCDGPTTAAVHGTHSDFHAKPVPRHSPPNGGCTCNPTQWGVPGPQTAKEQRSITQCRE